MTVTISGGKYANNTIATGTATTITSGSASISATNSLTAGSLVSFSATVGTGSAQVVAGTLYYVISTGLTTSAFEVSATLNGSAITFNASGTPTFILATSVTATTANFVSTDFTVQRIVGMWNSGGTTLLGMAYVRAFTSTSVLQLETPFFDPANPTVNVAQTAGNVIIVSKNFTDSVATGLAVANGVATITDVLVFGTSSSATAVCFYDQDIELFINYATTSGTTYITQSMLGGLVVYGKLENPQNNIVSNPVNILYGSSLVTAGSGNLFGIQTNYASSNFMMYGGQISGTGITIPIYHGGYNGTVGYTMIFNGVTTSFDMVSPTLGAGWGANAPRMQLINCATITSFLNAIGRRWGDGIHTGGYFRFPLATSQPVAALGAVNGNLAFGALPNQRAYVLDFGANQTPGASSSGSPVLVTGASNNWTITNLIATAYRAGTGTNPNVTTQTSVLVSVYFQDTFSILATTSLGLINTTGLTSSTNLNLGTPCTIGAASGTLSATIIGYNTFAVGQIVQFSKTVGTSGGQVVTGTNYYVVATGLTSSTFQVATTANGTPIVFNAAGTTTAYCVSGCVNWSPALLYGVWTGFSQTTATPAAWYYGIKAYGYSVVSGIITPSTILLLNNTMAPNVSFGTVPTQVVDPGIVSITQSVAANFTSISTLDQLYAAMSNWSCTNLTNAAYPNISTYPITFKGSVLNLGAMSLVLATTGAAFSINTSTNTLTINSTTLSTGTIFTSFTTTGSVTVGSSAIKVPYTCSAGTQGVLTINNLVVGSSIYITTASGTQIFYVASCLAAGQTFYIPPNTNTNYIYKVACYQYLPVSNYFNSQGVETETVTQVVDPYITQATVATVAAYTSLSSPDQIYDYAAYWETTNTGIAQTRATTGAVKILSFGTNKVVFNTAASAVYGISAGTATILTAATFVNGTTFSSGFNTSGTFTNTSSTTTIKCLYTTSVGTSLVVSLVTPAGSSVAILNGSGTVMQYTAGSANTTGNITYYATPGQTGTWVYRVANYTYLSYSEIFTPVGLVTDNITLVTDTGITQTTVSTVAAYTSLTTCDQLYDFCAYWQTTNNTGGIGVPNLVTKLGLVVNLAGITITFNNSTGTPVAFTVTSGAQSALTIETGGTFATGSTFTSFSTTSTTTLTSTTITCVYTNSSGTSTVLTITNLPYTSNNGGSYISIVNASAAQQQYVGPVTSGTQIIYIPPAAASIYTCTMACYGYLSTTNSFALQGYVTMAAALVVDTGITQTVAATVAAYTTVVTCDQVYDYCAYLQTQNGTGGITVPNLVTKVSTNISFASMAITINANSGTPVVFTVTSGAMTAITIKTGTPAVLATGTTFTSFSTTTSINLNGGATISCVYTNSNGTNTVLTITNLPMGSGTGGAHISIVDNTGAQLKFPTTTTGSATISVSSGAAYPLTCKLICYQYLPITSTLTSQGYISIVANMQVDPGITQQTRSTVAAYTSFTSPDQIYDYLAYIETTNGTAGSSLTARPVTYNGTSFSFGSCNIVFDATASATYTYTAGTPNTLTFKVSTLVAGTTYAKFTTTGTVSLADGAILNLPYSYATGSQVALTITNLVVGSIYGIITYSGGTVITSGTAATSSVTYYYQWTTNISVYVRARYYGTSKYLPFETIATITNAGLSINANQLSDAVGN